MIKPGLTREIALPAGVSASLRHTTVIIRGSEGEAQRDINHPHVKVSVEKDNEKNKIVLSTVRGTRREKTLLGSLAAHLKNLVKGVQEQQVYKLKVCSGHFPMTVTVSGTEFVVKNFLGESVPRTVDVVPGVTIKVNDKEILVTSPDKEKAGLMTERIEQLCRITNRDVRIFMDGIWITEKAGKAV